MASCKVSQYVYSEVQLYSCKYGITTCGRVSLGVVREGPLSGIENFRCFWKNQRRVCVVNGLSRYKTKINTEHFP